MFSFVERATTRTFMRVLVIALAAALLCGSLPVVLLAREVDKTPCELPGDGEGVGGYKNYEFDDAPSPVSGHQVILPARQDGTQVAVRLRLRRVILIVQFYLAMHK